MKKLQQGANLKISKEETMCFVQNVRHIFIYTAVNALGIFT